MGYETRHFVKDVDGLRCRLETLGYQKKEVYCFIDHIFAPKKVESLENYNPETCVIKLREYPNNKDENKIIIAESEFNEGIKSSEKIEIRAVNVKKSSLSTLIKEKLSINRIVKDFDIEEKFRFFRFGEEYVANDGTIIYIENIEHMGNMVEIEAEKIETLNEQIKEISEFVSKKVKKSLPKLIEEKIKTYKN